MPPRLDAVLHRLAAAYYWTFRALGVALLAALTLTTLAQVVFRYFLDDPLTWSEELARYLFVWLSLGLAGLAYHHGELIAFEWVTRSVRRPIRLALLVLADLLVLALLAILVERGWAFAQFNRIQIAPALGISMFWVYLAIPVGSALLFLHVALRLLRRLLSKGAAEGPAE